MTLLEAPLNLLPLLLPAAAPSAPGREEAASAPTPETDALDKRAAHWKDHPMRYL